jgi:hypothetical protein
MGSPRFLEWNVFCQQGAKNILYRLYVELTDEDRTLLTSEDSSGDLKLIAYRTCILSILPDTVTPLDVGAGQLVEHDIDARIYAGTEVRSGGRRAWVLREESIG